MVVNNKQKKLTIVAVVTLIALVAGATYAYFSVGVTSNFGTSTINATADNIGTVTLNGSSANLNLHVTAVDMMKKENSINYYATPDGTSTDETEKETVLGTASVSPTTDTNYYHCTYTLNVTQSYSGDKNMYNIFKGTQQVNNTAYTSSANELVLTVNGTDYDLNSNTLPKEIDGEFYIQGSQTVDITAGLRLVNLSNKDQTLLAGSGVNISIQVKQNSFSCTAEDEPPTITSFYIGGSSNPSNIYFPNTTVYLTWNDTDVDSYCISTANSSNGCTWLNLSSAEKNSKSVTANYTLSSETGIKSLYAFLKDKDNNISTSSSDTITLNEATWVYYGWNGDTPSNSFDGARGEWTIAFRSLTGVKYSNITIDDAVQVCGLIDGEMYCVDYFDSTRGDGTRAMSSEDGVWCQLSPGNNAMCSDYVCTSANDCVDPQCVVFGTGSASCGV